MSRNFKFIIVFLVFIASCLGVGTAFKEQVTFQPISYEYAFEVALKSAERMSEECKRINPFNFPILVSIGTSKARGVITVHYRFDPEAGSLCTKPPIDFTSFAKRTFVPHFGAEFYMHIKILREETKATGINIDVTQAKGVKKEVFNREMERLREVYKTYFYKNLKN